MMNRTRPLALLAVTGVLLSGCADAPTGLPLHVATTPPGTTQPSRTTSSPATATGSSTTGSTALATGPGPSGHYTVQAQPGPGTCHYRVLDAAGGRVLPDPTCTPGAINPAVTPATLATTICRSGYTASIRPPTTITRREKAASVAAYAYAGNPRVVEYDHLISLELGGDPNDPRNLWPEPNSAKASSFTNAKDAVESRLHALVCRGTITLAVAQRAIATDWTTALVAVGSGT